MRTHLMVRNLDDDDDGEEDGDAIILKCLLRLVPGVTKNCYI